MNPNRREFLLATAGAGIVATAGQSGRGEAKPPGADWARKPGRVYFYDQYALNEQASAFSRYDPDRITDELLATGADVIVIYCSNQFSIAYYPSKIWPQHPNLKGRDYVGDLYTRLRKHGKKLGAYVNWMDSIHSDWLTLPAPEEGAEPKRANYPLVSWADPSNPERRIKKIPGGVRRNPCINSPRGKQILAVAREIVERYQPDFFCLDAFHVVFDHCVCDYCRPTLEKICGTKELTQKAITSHWREYIDWKMERSAAVVADLSAMLRANGVLTFHNAGVPIPVRAAGGAGEDWIPTLDIVLLEGFGSLDLITMTLRACASLGKPLWQLMTSTPQGYAHLTIPPAWWLAAAATCKANGAEMLGPCGIGAWPDTTTSKGIYGGVKIGFEEFMRSSDLTAGSASAAKVGLLFSWNCRKYFPEGGQEWSQEMLGWSRVLLRQHIPFDIPIVEQTRSAADFEKYDLVILPNLPYLSDAFCAALSEYVRTGGRVLSTGGTSTGTDKGFPRTDFGLTSLLGISRKGSFTGNFAFEAPEEPVPASGKLYQVAATGTVMARMMALDPAGSVKGFRDPMPLGPGEWPIAVRNAHGRGTAVYVAFEPGVFYAANGLKQTEAFMVRLIDALLPERQLEVRAPFSVEATVRTQTSPERHIVHLANRTHSPNDLSKVTELVPVHDIEVSLASPYPRARVECRGGSVQVRNQNGRLSIQLARLDAHEAIVITPA